MDRIGMFKYYKIKVPRLKTRRLVIYHIHCINLNKKFPIVVKKSYVKLNDIKSFNSFWLYFFKKLISHYPYKEGEKGKCFNQSLYLFITFSFLYFFYIIYKTIHIQLSKLSYVHIIEIRILQCIILIQKNNDN